MLFRWFLDLGIEEASFDHSTFSANRERLMKHEVAGCFAAVVAQAQKAGLTSSEQFSVDGTLIEAWASMAGRPSSPNACGGQKKRAKQEGALDFGSPTGKNGISGRSV